MLFSPNSGNNKEGNKNVDVNYNGGNSKITNSQ